VRNCLNLNSTAIKAVTGGFERMGRGSLPYRPAHPCEYARLLATAPASHQYSQESALATRQSCPKHHYRPGVCLWWNDPFDRFGIPNAEPSLTLVKRYIADSMVPRMFAPEGGRIGRRHRELPL